MKFVLFLALSLSSYAFAGTPVYSGSSINCVSCRYTNGTTNWLTSGANDEQAKRISLAACRNGSRKACKYDGCWERTQYNVSTCKVSTAVSKVYVAPDYDDDYYEPQEPTPTFPSEPEEQSCHNRYGCSFNEVCVGGKCVPDYSWDNRCSSDFECGFPGTCSDGKCG